MCRSGAVLALGPHVEDASIRRYLLLGLGVTMRRCLHSVCPWVLPFTITWHLCWCIQLLCATYAHTWRYATKPRKRVPADSGYAMASRYGKGPDVWHVGSEVWVLWHGCTVLQKRSTSTHTHARTQGALHSILTCACDVWARLSMQLLVRPSARFKGCSRSVMMCSKSSPFHLSLHTR